MLGGTWYDVLGAENPLFERLLTLESKGVDSCPN